ncbi:hypothetical protein [Pantoea sp. DY-5]|uniref:hypothetical protein n=1 Tax=Pantoea sp. DY-5 TaxID=2871488 RepID=UPI001C9567AC|nr:hypothetical protein [Pantoea sp. DY-5]MBY4840944.1 hypothetical protein [Pantoea sp. DY-5]
MRFTYQHGTKCLPEKQRISSTKQAASDLWRQKYQDSVTNREAQAKLYLFSRQVGSPDCKPPATVADLCAAFVAESPLLGAGLEIYRMDNDDNHVPEYSTLRSEHG